jgi:hypothetical protein
VSLKIFAPPLEKQSAKTGVEQMNQFPPKKIVEQLRQSYPKGTRVELVKMDDPYTGLRPGDKGTVDFVDDSGTYEKLYVMESKCKYFINS